MQPVVLGDRWFGSKREVLKELKRVRESGPCPRNLTEAEMSWILPLVFKHPRAPLLLNGWDASSLRVDIKESDHGNCFVRCFKFRMIQCSWHYISMSDCLLRGTIGNAQAILLANSMMAEICRAFVDAADEACTRARA